MEREDLQGACVAFSLAARLVSCEPDEIQIGQYLESRPFAAAPFGEKDPAVVDGLRLLDAWCSESAGDAAGATAEVRREWLRLLVGCGEPEAPVVESYYTDPSKKLLSATTVDMRRRYREWGLEFERAGSEPDDSLGLMLVFCAHLMAEELKALEAGNVQAVQRALCEQEEVLTRHMLPWASSWRFLMARHARTDYYRGIGELVFGLERAYAARFGISFHEEKGSLCMPVRSTTNGHRPFLRK